MKRESHHYHRDLVFYASIGFQFGISIVVGLLLGLWLDGKYDTSPWLLLVGIGLGIAAGFRNLALVIKRVRKF